MITASHAGWKDGSVWQIPDSDYKKGVEAALRERLAKKEAEETVQAVNDGLGCEVDETGARRSRRNKSKISQ